MPFFINEWSEWTTLLLVLESVLVTSWFLMLFLKPYVQGIPMSKFIVDYILTLMKIGGAANPMSKTYGLRNRDPF
jgi:hypothetical protein